MAPRLIAIMGPTASGKSDLAEAIADRLGALLLNADAFQVYRGMDIGTAKTRHKDRYRLLDLKEPTEDFGLGEWLRLAVTELEAAWERDQSVVVVGGTGLYMRALFEGYSDLAAAPSMETRAYWREQLDRRGLQELVRELQIHAPATAAETDTRNPVRVTRALERLNSPRLPPIQVPPYAKVKLGLNVELDILQSRIETRVHRMMEAGWLQEVRTLMDIGISKEAPGMRAIGYRTWYDQLSGKQDYEEALRSVLTQTNQYAKRQRTWLRREPSLVTVDAGRPPDLEALMPLMRE